MNDNPYESPHVNSATDRRTDDFPEPARRRWRPSLVELLCGIVIACILAAMLMPAVQTGGRGRRRPPAPIDDGGGPTAPRKPDDL